MIPQTDWYEQNVEAGVRDVVRLLRDNGVNTTYSCHHGLAIEAESYEDDEASKIYDLLVENGYDGFRISLVLYKEKALPLRRHVEIHFLKCPVCGAGSDS